MYVWKVESRRPHKLDCVACAGEPGFGLGRCFPFSHFPTYPLFLSLFHFLPIISNPQAPQEPAMFVQLVA